ncbi:SIMPL domain-containing protein [Nonomuraea salmonea]|uniref:SIMPL domain-containing protein n=1 Tax=Nonomuraea salmonea TaxID=46181 RepID=UPI0031ED85A1
MAFELSDPAAALAEARERAFRDAAAKAAQYAALAGRPLGRVVSVSELRERRRSRCARRRWWPRPGPRSAPACGRSRSSWKWATTSRRPGVTAAPACGRARPWPSGWCRRPR